MGARLPLVLMASVLNPKEHPRIWYREGKTLSENGYRIEILSAAEPFRKDWRFRIGQQFRLIKKILHLHPDVLHLHTPELAWIALLLKPILRYKLIYDRHENYPIQIKLDQERPAVLKTILFYVLRLTEKVLFQFSDLILLAEPGYRQDAPKRAIVIRNAYTPIIRPTADPEGPEYFLISGALSEKNGIREACEFWKDIRNALPWQLHICGHAQEQDMVAYLRTLKADFPEEVHLEGIETPVPYARIQEKIALSACGLALFQESPHLSGKIPSRFFEFIGLKKPLLVSGNKEWARAFFPENIRYMPSGELDSQSCANWLTTHLSFDYNPAPWTWEAEATQFLQAYHTLTKKTHEKMSLPQGKQKKSDL